jgi:hypothetical protein
MLWLSEPIQAQNNTEEPVDSTQLLILRNDSNQSIKALYLAPVGTTVWGENKLAIDGFELLQPQEGIELLLPCGEWAVKLVSETGIERILSQVQFCANKDENWSVK